MKSSKSLVMIIGIVLVVIALMACYTFVLQKNNKEEVIVNDGKNGFEVEIVDKVPDVVYDNEFYYDSGYKLIEKDGSYYIYISAGERRTENNKVEIEKIVINGKDIDITLKGDISGDKRLVDDKIGCVSIGVKLNKKPENITVHGIEKETLKEIEFMNISSIIISGLETGSLEPLKYLEKALEKYELNVAAVYKKNTYDGLFGISSLLEEIDLTREYEVKITTESGKDIINISDKE